MTDLQLCITLSQRAGAALEREDFQEGCRLMRERDAVFRRLDAVDVNSFVAWAEGGFTPEQVAAFLDTGDRSHIAMTRGDLEVVAENADKIAAAVQAGRLDEAASLYSGEIQDYAGLPPVYRTPRGSRSSGPSPTASARRARASSTRRCSPSARGGCASTSRR